MAQSRMRLSPIRLVFDGQSMLWLPPPPNNVPKLVGEAVGLPYINMGIAGHGWYDRNAVADNPTTGIKAQVRNKPSTIDILIMFGGQGDVLNGSPSGQQTGAVCYDRAVDYAAMARTAGFQHVIGVTWPHLGPNMLGTGRPTPSELTAWEDAVDLYWADSEGAFDAIVDCHTAPFDDATNLTYFLFDRLHLSQEGGDLAAARIVAVLEPYLAAL